MGEGRRGWGRGREEDVQLVKYLPVFLIHFCKYLL